MKTRSSKASLSSGRDAGLRNSAKSPGKPLTPEKDKHMDACHDPVDTSDQCVQSQAEGELQNPEVIHIKSEPFCEDLWDVLDELGVLLAEVDAESDLDEKPVITPPPPSITLADDSSLFTRRSKPDCDVSPISFNESLQESGEILSSEENNTEINISEGMEPVLRINSSAKDSQKERSRSSPEGNSRRHWDSTAHKEWLSMKTTATKAKEIKSDQRNPRSKSKERTRARKKSSSLRKISISRSPSPTFRGRRRSSSRNSSSGRERSSQASRRRHRSQSRDHIRRRRSFSRDRLKRRRIPVSPRPRFRSRSRSPDRTSRSRSIRNHPSDRRLRDVSPSIRHYRGRPRSPGFGWRHGIQRYLPARLPRLRSRSRSRSAKNLVRRRLGNRVPFRERSKSSSRPRRIPFRKRSRSRSISANVMLRESSRNSGSKSRNPKIVPRQSSRSPRIHHEERQRSVSPVMTDRVASPVESSPPASSFSPILPKPISPMVTQHDNRLTRPKELRQHQLPTPPDPQVVYKHFTHLEYSSQHYPGYLATPGPYSQHTHELGTFDLRRRLVTTRSLCCLRPHDLRHRIQDVCRPDIYSPPPAFNVYPEWPTGYPGQYHPSGYY
ncbi:serine/arginine repetitive matrix protein 2 [Drosophila elegans]|uniref:serine/arginine repetitive matrix protein 2 n=1 Tax=Drosophila elegans TaxID=30023 RepID=UPI0007E5D708|nr:serine/arginine repetitive matrix protein 2 [Drosophila elegans]